MVTTVRFKVVSLSLLTGLLLLLSYPPYNRSVLAWIALVPLTTAVVVEPTLGSTPRPFRWFFSAAPVWGGLLWGIGLFYPLLLTVEGTRVEQLTGLVVLTGLLIVSLLAYRSFLMTAIYAFRLPLPFLILFAPSAWVVVEFAVRHVAVGFSPYFGVTQWRVAPLLRVASATGIHGVGWLIAAANALISVSVIVYIRRRRSKLDRLSSRSEASKASVSASLFLIVVGLFAFVKALQPGFHWRVDAGDTLSSPRALDFVLVQPNFDADRYYVADRHPEHYYRMFDELLAQSEHALDRWTASRGDTMGGNRDPLSLRDDADRAKTSRREDDDADVVLTWPETVLHIHGWDDPVVRRAIESLADRWNAHVMIGLPRSGASPHWKGPGSSDDPDVQFNSIFVTNPQGDLIGLYDKVNVIPVAEAEFHRGSTIEPVPLAGHRLGSGICSDVVVPDHALTAARRGATSLHYVASLGQIPVIAPLERAFVPFRAAEHGTYVVQTATTGPSLVADPQGRIVSSIPPDHPGSMRVTIPATDGSPTVYTRFGDWIVALSAAIVMGLALVPRRR